MPALLIPILIAVFAEFAPSLGRLLAAALDSIATPDAPMPVVERVAQFAQWHVQNMQLSSAPYEERMQMARVALADDLKREHITLDAPTQEMFMLIAYNGLKAKADVPLSAPK